MVQKDQRQQLPSHGILSFGLLNEYGIREFTEGKELEEKPERAHLGGHTCLSTPGSHLETLTIVVFLFCVPKMFIKERGWLGGIKFCSKTFPAHQLRG